VPREQDRADGADDPQANRNHVLDGAQRKNRQDTAVGSVDGQVIDNQFPQFISAHTIHVRAGRGGCLDREQSDELWLALQALRQFKRGQNASSLTSYSVQAEDTVRERGQQKIISASARRNFSKFRNSDYCPAEEREQFSDLLSLACKWRSRFRSMFTRCSQSSESKRPRHGSAMRSMRTDSLLQNLEFPVYVRPHARDALRAKCPTFLRTMAMRFHSECTAAGLDMDDLAQETVLPHWKLQPCPNARATAVRFLHRVMANLLHDRLDGTRALKRGGGRLCSLDEMLDGMAEATLRLENLLRALGPGLRTVAERREA